MTKASILLKHHLEQQQIEKQEQRTGSLKAHTEREQGFNNSTYAKDMLHKDGSFSKYTSLQTTEHAHQHTYEGYSSHSSVKARHKSILLGSANEGLGMLGTGATATTSFFSVQSPQKCRKHDSKTANRSKDDTVHKVFGTGARRTSQLSVLLRGVGLRQYCYI